MFTVPYLLSVSDIWAPCTYSEVKFMYVWCGRADHAAISLGTNLMQVLSVNSFIPTSIVFLCAESTIIRRRINVTY